MLAGPVIFTPGPNTTFCSMELPAATSVSQANQTVSGAGIRTPFVRK